jgi:hypothetical protein
MLTWEDFENRIIMNDGGKGQKAQEVARIYDRIQVRMFELERKVEEYEKNRRMQELASPPPIRNFEQIDYEYFVREIMKHTVTKEEEPEKFKLPKELFEIE